MNALVNTLWSSMALWAGVIMTGWIEYHSGHWVITYNAEFF